MRHARTFLALAVLVLAVAPALAATDVLGGIRNYWSFNEGQGLTAHDATGRNDGTLTNFQFDSTDGWRKGRGVSATSAVPPSTTSSCLKFDGKDDYVGLNNAFALPDNASISAWVNVQGFDATSSRFYILTDTEPSPLMGPSGSPVATYDLGTSTFVQSDGSVWITERDIGHVDSLHTAPGLVKADGRWHQIAFVRGNWSEAIYIDGVKRAQGPLSVDTYVAPLGSGTIGSGTYRVSPSGPSILCSSNGLIDDVRVYNRLLVDANSAVNTSAGGDITDLFLSSLVSGDANLDGTVDFADYLSLEQGFGQTGAFWTNGDFNGDGTVNFADYLLLEGHFGQAIPEPATLSLLALAGLAVIHRKAA